MGYFDDGEKRTLRMRSTVSLSSMSSCVASCRAGLHNRQLSPRVRVFVDWAAGIVAVRAAVIPAQAGIHAPHEFT
jgi:hypothetical protein